MKFDHELKSWPEFFEPLAGGQKPFDLRKNDRKFKVGDVIKFVEYNDRRGVFTGHAVIKRVTYIQEGIGSGSITPLHGLQRGYCILGLADLTAEEREQQTEKA